MIGTVTGFSNQRKKKNGGRKHPKTHFSSEFFRSSNTIDCVGLKLLTGNQEKMEQREAVLFLQTSIINIIHVVKKVIGS